jgi:hypothetical protein
VSTVLLAPLVGVFALCVAIAGWDAAVFARRHFEQPRQRILDWTRECGEALEVLTVSGAGMLKEQREPPIAYGLRSYLLFQLLDDLDDLEYVGNFKSHKSSLNYVEPGIVNLVVDGVRVAMHRWALLHGVRTGNGTPEPATPTPRQVYDLAHRGLQRVGMLQEHVLHYKRMPWIVTVLKRPMIRARIRRRREMRAQLWRDNPGLQWTSDDVMIPL